MSDAAIYFHVVAFLYRPKVKMTVRVLVWSGLVLAAMLGPYIIGGLLGAEPQ